MRTVCTFRGKVSTHVSFRYAPSFRQPQPHEVVGVPAALIPRDCVPAFVLPGAVGEEEEKALLALTEPWFARLPYNDGHVDSLIHHFKEFYRSYEKLLKDASGRESDSYYGNLDAETIRASSTALKKCRDLASQYLVNIPLDDRVHFLRLSSGGFIRAHVDDSRNSSGIIAGLSLGSARVMSLTHPKHPGERVELLLEPRSLYVLIGAARYEWEHSTDWVRDDDEHLERVRGGPTVEETPITFDGKQTHYKRTERTAVIFRGVSPMDLLLSKIQKKQATK